MIYGVPLSRDAEEPRRILAADEIPPGLAAAGVSRTKHSTTVIDS